MGTFLFWSLVPCPRPLVGFTGLGLTVGSGWTYLAVGTAGFMVAAGLTAGIGGMYLDPAPEFIIGI